MINSQQHEMQLETTHLSGAQEWYCPTCAYRFIVQWQPKYNRIILETGDSYAGHVGSTSDELRTAPLQLRQIEEQVLSDELRAALEELDLDDLFGKMD
jgi:hypothetical protein